MIARIAWTHFWTIGTIETIRTIIWKPGFKKRAYHNYGRTQGKKARKLNFEELSRKQTLNRKIGYTYGKNLEQKSALK